MDWYESEAYKQLTEALRAMDYARAAAIIHQQISVTEGPDQVYWQRMRIALATQVSPDPRSPAVAFAETMRLIDRCDPTDSENRRSLLVSAINLSARLERFDQLPGILARLRPELRHVIPTYGYWVTRAAMHKACGRWRKAYRAFDRTLKLALAWPEPMQKPLRGWLVFYYAERAIAGLRCGVTERAAADVAAAEAIYREFPRAYMNPLPLFLAIGELAFFQGRLRDARSALQQGLARYAECQYRGRWSPVIIDYELLAARIALAEGNREGFRHFCSRALALCAEHDLPLSAARVRTLLESAER